MTVYASNVYPSLTLLHHFKYIIAVGGYHDRDGEIYVPGSVLAECNNLPLFERH